MIVRTSTATDSKHLDDVIYAVVFIGIGVSFRDSDEGPAEFACDLVCDRVSCVVDVGCESDLIVMRLERW